MVDLIPIPDGFQITPHLAVKINREAKAVYAWVAGQEVRQCRYALITVPTDTEIEDVDELIHKYSYSENQSRAITKAFSLEEELFAHASNLQAWVEHDYDARIIHTNLAWPLLDELAPYDKHAHDRLLEQVHERWEQGSEASRRALLESSTVLEILRQLIHNNLIDIENEWLNSSDELKQDLIHYFQPEIMAGNLDFVKFWNMASNKLKKVMLINFREKLLTLFASGKIDLVKEWNSAPEENKRFFLVHFTDELQALFTTGKLDLAKEWNGASENLKWSLLFKIPFEIEPLFASGKLNFAKEWSAGSESIKFQFIFQIPRETRKYLLSPKINLAAEWGKVSESMQFEIFKKIGKGDLLALGKFKLRKIWDNSGIDMKRTLMANFPDFFEVYSHN